MSKGGHNIEPKIIKRYFIRGLANLKEYVKIVNTATIYASALELKEIAKKEDEKITAFDKNLWNKIYEF